MGSTCLDHATVLPEPNMEVKGSQITGTGMSVPVPPGTGWGAGWVAVARPCLHEVQTVVEWGREKKSMLIGK